MQIEAGKYYRTRDGRKVGPTVDCGAYLQVDGYHYSSDGTCSLYGKGEEALIPNRDLIAEWTDTPDLSNPHGTVFGMLPPETQEAMKAHGGPWEMFTGRMWSLASDPSWDGELAYRVKPGPKLEAVMHDVEPFGWPRMRFTATRIDGVVQPTATVEII